MIGLASRKSRHGMLGHVEPSDQILGVLKEGCAGLLGEEIRDDEVPILSELPQLLGAQDSRCRHVS